METILFGDNLPLPLAGPFSFQKKIKPALLFLKNLQNFSESHIYLPIV